ncbi:Pentatricopeptide repeat-containing protein, partial [Cucurbita argyrosperma subsp. argyrosperma]
MDDDCAFSKSEPRSSSPHRRSPPDPREARRVPKFTRKVSASYPEDNWNQRVNEHSEGSEKEPQPPRPLEADEIFKKMKETGYNSRSCGYTAVVDGFCKAEKLEEAIRIFRKMQNNGISPNA